MYTLIAYSFICQLYFIKLEKIKSPPGDFDAYTQCLTTIAVEILIDSHLKFYFSYFEIFVNYFVIYKWEYILLKN